MNAFLQPLVGALLTLVAPAGLVGQAGAAAAVEDSLVPLARARPMAIRDSVTAALHLAVREAPPASDSATARAGMWASAYAAAWGDPFLSRRVTLFESWSPAKRLAWSRADSVRRAGVSAYGSRGPAAARRLWRQALAQARSIPDSALIAALYGNIGAAYLADGALDSAGVWLARADRLAGIVGDLRVQANAVGALGGVAEERGDLAGARRRYGQATRLRERIGDSRGIAADQNNLGLLALAVGDLDEADRHFETALVANRGDGKDEAVATNLLNLGGIASTRGEFALAESRYREALAIWRREGMASETAAALHGLGQLEVRRGDYQDAQRLLRQALEGYQQAGLTPQEVAVRRDLAGALSAMGQAQSARDELARAQELAERSGATTAVRARVTLSRADLAVLLNNYAEAERLYGDAARLFSQAGDAAGGAEADQGLGRLLVGRGDTTAARRLLEASFRVASGSGDRRAAGIVLLSIGGLAREAGDTAAARRAYAEARREFRGVGDAVAEAAAQGELAGLDREAGALAASIVAYREAIGLLAGLRAPEVSWQLRAGLAEAQVALGLRQDAARELRLAIVEVERAGSEFRAEPRRTQFMADKWGVYAGLARVEASLGLRGDAFQTSERLRSREMLALLSRGRLAAPAPTAALFTREQDLRRQITELASAVEPRPAAPTPVRGPANGPADLAALEALTRAQAAYQELLVEMRERAPASADLVAPNIATWRQVSARLGAGDAMIEYLVDDAETLAFVIRRDTIDIRTLGVGRRTLSRLIEFARGTIDPPGRDRSDSLWRGPLRQLHQFLIGQLEEAGLLDGVTRLVLVPHGELHYLPYAALLEAGPRGRFLVQRYEITTTPSASVWVALGDRRPSQGREVLALAPEVTTLPATRREAERVGGYGGPSAVVLLGDEASEARFRREAPQARVIHLATNGVLNQLNPLFSNVVLASGQGEDGRLETHEIFGLQLQADLVVLSACQTALGSGASADLPPGDDWVGLTRAFLSAGTSEVLATLWAVDDWATAELMDRFYLELDGRADAPAALAQAQRAILARRGLAHPYYWAGFTIVGGPPRRLAGARG